MSWQAKVAALSQQKIEHVLVTVLAVSGSAPREPGTKMVVTPGDTHATIGGGELEFQAVAKARALLGASHPGQVITHFPLAAAVGQCCGGSVTLMFETFVYPHSVAVFGAGHVGLEVADLLQSLDYRVRLIDNRSSISGRTQDAYEKNEDPVACVAEIEMASHVLIMTHSHELDYRLLTACLESQRQSIGLIGSPTKWARFRSRLIRDGFTAAQLDRVRCPVGVPDVQRNEPKAVAIAVVAELLQLESAADAPQLSWRQIKTSLVSEPAGQHADLD